MKTSAHFLPHFKPALCHFLKTAAPIAALMMSVTACSWTTIGSLSYVGEQGNNASNEPALSSDGRYLVFTSLADNLVSADYSSQVPDIFRRDLLAKTTLRASLNNQGVEANGASATPKVSGDGSVLVFTSVANNLVPNDTNGFTDIFVKDIEGGAVTRVSVDSGGNQADGDSWGASVSANGNVIAFMSNATNLGAQAGNGPGHVFVHNRATGTTEQVSVDSAEVQANNVSYTASIAADGQFVAFSSEATNLHVGDTNGRTDVFVRDLQAGTTAIASISSAGDPGNSHSRAPVLSQHGRYVAFASFAKNLVSNDTNRAWDIFVHDRQAGTTERVSLATSGAEGALRHDNLEPTISHNGRYVGWASRAPNLVDNDTNLREDIFVRDRHTGVTTRVSVDQGGNESNNDSRAPHLSGDGRYIAYSSLADNLVTTDSNKYEDVIVRAVPVVEVAGMVPGMLPIGSTTAVTVTGSNFLTGATFSLQDATFSNLVIVDEQTMTMDVTVPAGTTAGARNPRVFLFGTGPGQGTGAAGICMGCATFF